MNISFTGINNLKIKALKFDTYGSYLNNTSEIVQGDKYYTLVSIKADLDGTIMQGENTNQAEFVPHITQYFESLRKLKHFVLAQRILKLDAPGEIELIMKHFNAPDNLGNVDMATFNLNGEDIPLLHRNVLPLYSFLARFTKDILKCIELPEGARKYVKLVNDSISREAEEFIENINL